jgi:hypothetical protein
MTHVAGTDRRERQQSFLEPLELEDLDGPPADDPAVFDRVTAVPGELPTLVPAAGEPPPQPAPASSVTAAQQPPDECDTFDSEPPPVLGGGPASSSRRPRRASSHPPRPPSRPTFERTGRRSENPPLNTAGIELELADTPVESAVTHDPDALEAELPLMQPIALGISAPPPSTEAELIDMKDRYATGDFSGALVIAEGILETHPEHEEALRCQARCVDVLSQMYLARLGSLRQVVQVALSAEQIRWLSLDHRAGFLLSLVDGISSIEELLDISSMPRLEALRILYGLLDQRVIALSG